MPPAGAKGKSPKAAPEQQSKTSGGKRGRSASSSQQVLEEAAADAADEASLMSQETESEEPDSGAGPSKRQSLPDGLLERRLEKSNAEKNALATKIAELEKRLSEKDVSAESPRPETGAKAARKVEHQLIL